MSRHLPILVGFLVALGTGCKSNPVGRVCILDNPEADGGVPQTVIGSPALECDSRICLHLAGRSPDMCTATCEGDSDCDTAPESPCKGGFACVVPVVTGSFCCEKLCACKDQLDPSITASPPSCDASNPNNECCNLSGRRGNPKYPLCQ